jgi:hypothetical protein
MPLLTLLSHDLDQWLEERREKRWLRWFLLKHEVRRVLLRLRGHDPDEVEFRW